MSHSNAYPLPRPRLERLLNGLQQRSASSAQQLSSQVGELTQQIRQLEQAHRQQLGQLAHESQQQQLATTDQWDESRLQYWDAAELKAYRAVSETHSREKKLREEAQADLEHVREQAKSRATDLEKQFMVAVEAAGAKLTQYRGQIAACTRTIAGIQQAADAALAVHNLSQPQGIENFPATQPADSQQALKLAEDAVRTAGQVVHKLENLPLGRFLSSVTWWLLCGLFFVVTSTGLIMGARLPPLLAIPIGVGGTCAMVVAGMLGVRPWQKRAAAAEYPRVRGQLAVARKYQEQGLELATHEQEQELKKRAQKRDERLEQVKSWQRSESSAIKQRLETTIARIRATAQQDKSVAAQELTSHLQEVDQRFTQLMHEGNQIAQQRESDANQQVLATTAELNQRIEWLTRQGSWRLNSGVQKALRQINRCRNWHQARFPDWAKMETLPDWPELLSQPVLPIGQLQLDGASFDWLPAEQSSLTVPWLYSPLIDNYLVIHGDPAQRATEQLVRSLILRALTTLPAGKTQICVIDPPGLGRDFGWLMSLGDIDPALVSHRVWTQPSHIARQLQTLAAAAEDFIQQSLRNQFSDISAYNRQAGALAEPFRLLVWSSFPNGLDESSWKSLQSLLDSGARCGILPILIVSPASGWTGPQRDYVQRRGMHVQVDERDGISVQSLRLGQQKLICDAPATQQQTNAMIAEVGRRAQAASRVEVPLARMIPIDPPQRWRADSSRLLEIPIGQSGVGRVHSLKLGVGTAQHAIIAGKTGSGKSSLLHALITSALIKYSPERLRLVLLDFKKGVEFQVYSDAQIAHADIIGIESHREFGLSALEYIDDCLQRRGELFRQAGVQDIASWNQARPPQAMPRMLLVVDEFQELFVEDDKLSQAASLILDRIVRQGRSFGVHAVLSSQTLAGAYSLPRTTLGQMAVRIALQCDASDAQIIFSEDNPAAARLKYPGQAIYNDAGGRIEGNQPMQIGWLDKATQVQWFADLPRGYRNADGSTNRLGRTVVFDGNRPALWQPDQVQRAIQQASNEVNAEAIWCAVGESVAIRPAVVFPLTNQSGRNMLIVGGEDSLAAAVIHVVSHSLIQASLARQVRPQVAVIQGAKPTDTCSLALPNRLRKLPCELSVADMRTADVLIQQAHGWLLERMADPTVQHPPVLLTIIQLGRLRSLRREDEFSFGQEQVTPDKLLEEILRDGPSHGMHTLMWAESYSTVNRWLSRTALREIEIRLLMQMSANDSSNLADSIAASKLGDYVMLLYDEATGQEQKFRPYAWNSLETS
ncbi:MAG: hypothetical protein KF752_07700 [Pirellulaceae bacterium]|nr:hypothetical protein [Pirellulaceae bacterium]